MTLAEPAHPEAGTGLRQLRHELRTPINHILGYCQLLLEEAEERGRPEQIADLRRIEAAGEQLLTTVADVLDAAGKGGSRAVDTERAALELRTQLTAIIGYSDLLREEAEDGESEDGWLLSDAARIHTAATQLLNLLDTALEVARLSAAGQDEVRRTPVVDVPDAPASHLAQGTLLVVDDNPQNREVLSRRLERQGYRVVTAEGGREALSLLRSRSFDLLLLDVLMPEVDGLQVLRELKADPFLNELPVLVLSANDELADAVTCLRLGADDYLAKPVNPVILQARIRACLERKQLRDRELDYLRQTAQVTGLAAIAQLLHRSERGTESGEEVPVIAGMEAALLAELDETVEWVALAKGSVLMRAGEPSTRAYVLLDGRLQVIIERDGERTVAAHVFPGETVGEWGLMSGQPHAATVVASRDSRLAVITREAFGRLAERHPRALTRTDRDVIGRLRHASHVRPPEPAVTAIAVVPVSEGLPRAGLAQSLVSALAAAGPTLHLSRERLAGLLGEATARVLETPDDPPGAVNGEAWVATRLLADLEQRYRYVVYEADRAGSPWSDRCLRQADRVLLVGRSEQEPSPGLASPGTPGVGELVGMRRELVLLNDGAPRPGTSRWLAAAGHLDGHHHLCLDVPADVQRLARRLTNRAVGLVLGGGGMRAAAHVGAVRALRQAGVPIDLVGGTSAGALIAGQVAAGWDTNQMQRTNLRLLIEGRATRDFTVPVLSLVAGRRYVEALRQMFGETRIEDLALPYFAVAANLTRAEVVVQRRGPLARAIRASCSIPGVFPPVQDEHGDLLVDGGLLDNLPVDVMASECSGGPVIAVDLRVQVELTSGYALGDSVSGAGLLLNRANPLARQRMRTPGIASVLMRASLLASVQAGAVQSRRSSLYVNPPVGRFPLLDGAASREMEEMGYRTTSECLAEWLKTAAL